MVRSVLSPRATRRETMPSVWQIVQLQGVTFRREEGGRRRRSPSLCKALITVMGNAPIFRLAGTRLMSTFSIMHLALVLSIYVSNVLCIYATSGLLWRVIYSRKPRVWVMDGLSPSLMPQPFSRRLLSTLPLRSRSFVARVSLKLFIEALFTPPFAIRMSLCTFAIISRSNAPFYEQ